MVILPFWIREEARELDERGLARAGREGGIDRVGHVLAELGPGYWKLSEQSPSPDRDTHRAINWFCDIL